MENCEEPRLPNPVAHGNVDNDGAEDEEDVTVQDISDRATEAVTPVVHVKVMLLNHLPQMVYIWTEVRQRSASMILPIRKWNRRRMYLEMILE